MGKIDLSKAPVLHGASYPAPFAEPCRGRHCTRFSDLAGLTQFGANLTRLEPGAWSSQRHWHALGDELVYVLQGEVVMVTDAGEETLRAGDTAGFKAGSRDGHHFQNRSTADVVMLVVGTRDGADHGEYPDLDLTFGQEPATGAVIYRHKDGRPY